MCTFWANSFSSRNRLYVFSFSFIYTTQELRKHFYKPGRQEVQIKIEHLRTKNVQGECTDQVIKF
jgi:hypothetical protein